MAKKLKKIIPLAAAVIVCLWALIGVIDFSRVRSHKLPIFCVWSLRFLDGGSGTYTGLGYSFEIKGDFIGAEALGVTEYTAKIFGQPVLSEVSCR